MTHPEQGSPEPPTNHDPYAPRSPAPPSPQPWYPPGIASVPLQPQRPGETYDPRGYPVQQPYPAEPGYPEPGYPPPGYPEPGYQAAPPGYQPQPGYPPPGYPVDPSYAGTPYAPPPRGRNGLLIGLVVVLVVLGLTGGIVGGIFVVRAINAGNTTSQTTGPAGSPTGGAQSSTQPQTGSSAPAQVFNGNLNQLLLPRPAGSKPWQDFAVKDGTVLTLAQMANLFTDEKEMTSDLQSFKYRRGAVNHWLQNKIFVLVLIFQFDSSVNARAFVQGTKSSGLEGYEDKGPFRDIEGSLSFVDNTPNADGQRSIIFISPKNEIVSYVTVWYPGAIDTAGSTDLAVRQHQKLP